LVSFKAPLAKSGGASFVLSDFDGLQYGLRQVSDRHRGLGFDVALQIVQKDLAETMREIARGEIVGGDPSADDAAALAFVGIARKRER
jgi:hypothetical protein